MQQLIIARDNMYTALQKQDLAEAELRLAQKAYDEKLAEFEKEHRDIVLRRNQAIKKYDEANLELSMARATAAKELATDIFNNLPDGFSQVKGKRVIYDPQSFRLQALNHFQFLLKLDEEAIVNFFLAMIDEDNIIPEHIRTLCSVAVVDSITPDIHDDVIKKLQIVQNQDLSIFADALEEIEDGDDSPADENQFVKDVYQRPVVDSISLETSTDEDETVVPLEEVNS